MFFGSTPVAGRVLASYLPPLTATFLRFFLASFFLVFIVFKIYGKLPLLDFRGYLLALFIGITGMIGYNFFLFSGLHFITASRASIIIALNPSLISLFSIIIFKEKFTKFKFTGIVLSLIGAIIVISKGDLNIILQGKAGKGELFVLGTAICWVVFTLIGKVAMKEFKPIIIITYSCLISNIIMIVPVILEGKLQNIFSYNLAVWTSLFVLAFFGTVLAFIWFYEGIDKIGPSRTAVFNNFVPVFATIMAVFILHENITLSLVSGATLIISGIYLSNYQVEKRKVAMEAKP